jgi:hypothetical protein
MKLKIFVITIALLFGLVGCTTSTALNSIQLNNISKIGVLSTHNGKMEVIERGLTIFGNEDRANDISDWNINNFIQKEIINNITNKNFTTVSLSISKKELDLLNNFKYTTQYQDFFKKIMVKNNLNTLLVMICGGYAHNVKVGTSGIALIKAKTILTEKTYLQLNNSLRTYQLTNNKLEILHDNYVNGIQPVENELWLDTKKPVLKKNLSKLKKPTEELLKKSITKTMQLIGY